MPCRPAAGALCPFVYIVATSLAPGIIYSTLVTGRLIIIPGAERCGSIAIVWHRLYNE